MKNILLSFLLLLAMVAPVNAAGFSINNTHPQYLSSVTWTVHQKFTSIYVECTANSTTIVDSNTQSPLWAAYDNYNDGRFKLGESISPYWIGGGADCRADLIRIKGTTQTVVDSITFTVYP